MPAIKVPSNAADSHSLPREFSFLSRATLAAQAAEQIALLAVPLVAVLILNAVPKEVGLISAAQSLPFLLAAIPIGLLVDRVSWRRVLFLGELLRVIAFAVLLIALFTHHLSIGLLALTGMIGTLGAVAFIVASLVPRTSLPRSNARMEFARSPAFAGGPALVGALVVAALGAGTAFTVASALSTLALAALFFLPKEIPPPMAKRHPFAIVWWSDARRLAIIPSTASDGDA